MSEDSPVPVSAAPPRRDRLMPVLLILSVLGTLLLGGLVLIQQQGWTLDKPIVLGITPRPGLRDVGGKQAIAISFNIPMDHAAAQSALKVDPPTAGEAAWDGNTMVWTPKVGYQRGTTYTVQLDTSARSPLFQGLAAAAGTVFHTAGLPAVYRVVPPADATDVVTATTITIQFSQPMIPLTALDAPPVVGDKITITPAAAGQWKWLGTTALGFFPAAGLHPATRYAVQVSKRFTDLAGGELERDFSWSFTTPRPRVIGVAPDDQEDYALPTTPIVVRFNQPVDKASAQSGLQFQPAVSGGYAWSPAADVLTFTAAGKLPVGTPYRAQVSGVRPALGDLAQTAVFSWTFHTSPLARVLSTTPPEGGTKAVGDNVIVHYSAPLSATQKELLAALRLDPPVKGLSAYTYDNNTQLSVYAPFAPSSAYTLTVDSTLRDITGATVPGVTLHFRTAPYKPFAGLLNQNGVTTFYAGAPTRVYIDAVNVSRVTVNIYRLSTTQLALYLQSRGSDKLFKPNAPLRSFDMPLDRTPNRRQALRPNLALDAAADRLPPGFYYVEVRVPENEFPSGTAVVVGRTALTLKNSDKDYWVWAVDMGTGRPVANRAVRAVNDAGEILGRALTDQDGLARIDNVQQPNQATPMAVVDDGGDFALVRPEWSAGIASYNFDFPSYGLSGAMQGTLYTERPIYRPGQTVYFKGILRNDDDGRYTVSAGLRVPIELLDSNGNQVYSQTMTLGAYGTFSGQYTLGPAVPLGNYSLVVTSRGTGIYIGAGFLVAEYRKPEYLVGVTTGQPSYVNGDTIRANVAATYFFGGPVAGAAVTQHVLSRDYYFAWADPDAGAPRALRYDFQDYEALFDRRDSFRGQQRSETTATTGPDGKVAWTVPTNIGDEPLSQQFTLEASVMDTSNQEVSGNAQLIVHKGEFYIGLATDSYVNTAGKPLTVHVQTVNVDKSRRSDVPVTMTFFRREWELVDAQDGSGALVQHWKPKDTELATGPVTTDAQGRVQVAFTPQAAGEYRATAVARDSRGNTISSATYTWVSDPTVTGNTISWRQKNDFQIDMVADKAEYQPGDTAHILVTSPFTQATGLLTVERGHLREHRLVQLTGGSPVLDVPIPADYLPNVYLSLSVIAPAAATRNGQPAFRQGYVPLQVSPATKALQVEVKPSAERLHPRDTVTYTITTRDATGKPVPAELSLAVVDKALYSLAADNAPQLMDTFYGNRALSFNTASSLLVLNSLLQPAEGAPGSKGGGGGVRAGGGGDDFIRADFRDLAYWKADVTTGADGTAQVAVQLPDNLTTWRLTALAITGDTLVGSANSEVVVNKDLLLRPLSPRFLMVGDQAQPGAVVHNYTGQAWDVDVTLALSNATLVKDGPAATQRVNLPANGEATVRWQITAGSAATTTLTMTAHAVGSTGGSNAPPPSDSVAFRLPVKPFLAPEAVATSGEVAGDSTAQEQVFIPHGVDPAVGDLTIRVSPSLAATAGTGVDYLIKWPYESTEETVSRFYPLVVLDQAYQAARLTAPFKDTLAGTVNAGIQHLYSTQHYSGGWCWYDCGGNQASPSPWMTAYAFQGLSAAKAAGYPVADRVLDQATSFLTDWLNGNQASASPLLPGSAGANTRAFVLYALADGGRGDLALTRALAARAISLSRDGQIYLVRACQRLGQPADARPLLDTMTAAAKQTSTLAYWEAADTADAERWITLSSNPRTTALVLDALVAANKDDPLIPKTLRWLMAARQAGGAWSTTQETAQVLVALAHYLSASQELAADYTWALSLNGGLWGNGTVNKDTLADTVTLTKAVRDLLLNATNTVELRRIGSQGKLYYTMGLRYFVPSEGIPSRSEGLSVVREYLQPGTGAGKTPPTLLHQAAPGDLVQVRLTVIAPTDAYYLVVDDPLPAGLEAVDGSLQNTSLTEQIAVQDANSKEGGATGYRPSAFDHVEMRDDRTVLFATYLPAGVYTYNYLARATTPGQYNVLPTHAYLSYSPDVFGRSDGGQFAVTGK